MGALELRLLSGARTGPITTVIARSSVVANFTVGGRDGKCRITVNLYCQHRDGDDVHLFTLSTMPSQQAKNWVFTLNNYSEDDVQRLSALGTEMPDPLKYLVFGREVSESGDKNDYRQEFIYFGLTDRDWETN